MIKRLLDANQWQWDQLRPEQILLIAIVLIVLIVAVVAVIGIRRKTSRAVRELGFPLKSFRETNPCFYQVMAAVLKAGKSTELTHRGDVRAALRLLQEESRKKARRARKPDRSTSLLDKGGPGKGRREAATMTILRAVYMDESLCRALPNTVVKDIDRYLDSLTG